MEALSKQLQRHRDHGTRKAPMGHPSDCDSVQNAASTASGGQEPPNALCLLQPRAADEAGAAHAQGNQMRVLLRHPLTVMPQDELTPRETRAALGLTGEGWQDYSLSDMLKEGQ